MGAVIDEALIDDINRWFKRRRLNEPIRAGLFNTLVWNYAASKPYKLERNRLHMKRILSGMIWFKDARKVPGI